MRGHRGGQEQLLWHSTWIALPDHAEETTAQLEHHGKNALPLLEGEGKTVRLILGSAWGAEAPVKTFTEMFYADVVLDPVAALPSLITTRIAASTSHKVQSKSRGIGSKAVG